ncbi:hypothetical protein F5884DRAFT_849574 [Xylogone sp. PMI_703]|nr:hypothetical protein F5884DRAFT_849574 [Xylogone sp. PMI_703]
MCLHRFSSNPQVCEKSSQFSTEAKKLVKQDLENICLENVQACILIGNLCLAESNPDAESLYFVIANRMAQLLKIADDNPDDNAILREVKHRVWWSLYLIDRWASAGLGLPRQFHIGGTAPRLPMDEVDFFNMSFVDGAQELVEWKPGLWACMIALVQIFGHIQDLNRTLVESTQWNEEYIESTVPSLSKQLADFEQELPPTMVFTTENLALQIKRGVGGAFVALHLGYHHYATLLYYQYLDQYRPPTENGKMYAQRCKYHATAFCELLRSSKVYTQAEALYNIVGHMTVVSSSVLLHTLLFGHEDELLMARERLEANFQALVRLKEFWPSVDQMMNRLITFQNACLRTAQLETHRFDKWMVKFLLQHALALDEKMEYTTLVDRGLEQLSTRDEQLIERSRVTGNIIRGTQLENSI